MSRSNHDKPFYVDVGTSIAAVRCQSNMDVLDRFDHVSLGKVGIEMAEKMCDRINTEVDKFIAAKDAEIGRLRSLVKEMADALECAICGLSNKVVTYGETYSLVAKARKAIGGAE